MSSVYVVVKTSDAAALGETFKRGEWRVPRRPGTDAWSAWRKMEDLYTVRIYVPRDEACAIAAPVGCRGDRRPLTTHVFTCNIMRPVQRARRGGSELVLCCSASGSGRFQAVGVVQSVPAAPPIAAAGAIKSFLSGASSPPTDRSARSSGDGPTGGTDGELSAAIAVSWIAQCVAAPRSTAQERRRRLRALLHSPGRRPSCCLRTAPQTR